MNRPKIRIHNIETDEIIDREMSFEEYKKFQQEEKKYLEFKENEKAEADAKAAQRQALLNRLGITEEEARILLGGN